MKPSHKIQIKVKKIEKKSHGTQKFTRITCHVLLINSQFCPRSGRVPRAFFSTFKNVQTALHSSKKKKKRERKDK